MDDNPSALLRMLPPEILFAILIRLQDPLDLSAFSQACSATHNYCRGNELLWKETFLNHFDSALAHPNFKYEQMLKQRIRARGLIHRADKGRQLRSIIADHEPLLPIFNQIARQATSPTSLNTTFLSSLFSDSTFTASYLAAIAASTPDSDIAEFLMRFGPVSNTFTAPNITRAIKAVYTLSQYSEENHYGPYLQDGSGQVDWRIAENIRSVMFDNLRDARESEDWGSSDGRQITLPGDESWRDTARGDVALGERDWAGVEQGLIGTYVFADWNVFELINAEAPTHIPAAFLRRQGVGECQAINLTIDPSSPSPTPSDPYPRIDFTGTLSARDAISTPQHPSLQIEGFVEPVPGGVEGGVRWQFNVIYSGRPQWRLEGLQVSPRCRLGLSGMWHGASGGGREGPCGPFAFWTPLEE